MEEGPQVTDSLPPSLKIVPTIYPTSPSVEESVESFWEAGPELDSVQVRIEPPETPLALLEQLGPSPFGRPAHGENTPGLIGFLATTYEKVSWYALERARPS